MELYNTVQIASMYLGNIDSNVKTAMRERSYAMNNNEMELLTGKRQINTKHNKLRRI